MIHLSEKLNILVKPKSRDYAVATSMDKLEEILKYYKVR